MKGKISNKNIQTKSVDAVWVQHSFVPELSQVLLDQFHVLLLEMQAVENNAPHPSISKIGRAMSNRLRSLLLCSWDWLLEFVNDHLCRSVKGSVRMVVSCHQPILTARKIVDEDNVCKQFFQSARIPSRCRRLQSPGDWKGVSKGRAFLDHQHELRTK